MNLEVSAFEALYILKEHVIDMNVCYNRLMKDNERMREALELIATPKRPDGTYNRSREACEQLAREALEGK